ncbi:MAG: hypothetical protein DRP63_02135 [Planctomycetota bacterium]|nr:MAG: hypothetical protein DRP63_02135 [Planctomycetota bacterium]
MRVAAVQFAPAFGKKSRNIAVVRRLLSQTEADLFVLPELCTTGYQFRDKDELLRYAEGLDGPTVCEFVALASEVYATIVFGFAELRGGEVYNSAAVVTPNGLVGAYRKIHLFGREKELFVAGEEEPPVSNIDGLRLGVMICYDWAFCEVGRVLMVKGAQVVAHPANLMLPFCQKAMPTRALENRLFFVTANRTGEEARVEPPCRFTGLSQIVAPDGSILAAAGKTQTTVITADIDPQIADRKEIAEGVNLLEDRRPHLYRSLWGKRSSTERPRS